jgi:tetratricopeptide (TPR) repeat protein
MAVGGVFAWRHAPRAGTLEAEAVEQHLLEAQALLAADQPDRAIREHLDLVLQNDPQHAAAVALKQQAEESLKRQAVDRHLSEARALVAAGQPDAATREHLDPVLQNDPQHAEAAALKQRAEEQMKRQRDTAKVPEIRSEPGSQNRVPRSQSPGTGNTVVPPRRPEATYGRAKASLAAGDLAAAIVALEAVVKADPQYMDAASLLVETRARLAATVREALAGAAAAEAKGDWASALKLYERAQQADPATNVEQELSRVRDHVKRAAYKDYAKGLAEERVGRLSEAIVLYERVVASLPPEDPTCEKAKQRLAQLK